MVRFTTERARPPGPFTMTNFRLTCCLLLMTNAAVMSRFCLAADSLNVLFIAVDDLRPEMGCYGVASIKTPNLDRLAASGTRFEKAYCQQAVCGASRLSIMSGLYPVTTGEQSYHVRGWRERHPNLLTLNQHFRNGGFESIGLGKIYHDRAGPGADEREWDQLLKVRETMYADPKNLAFKRQFSVHKSDTYLGSVAEALDVPDDRYADGKRAAQAVRVIQRLAKTKQPFFLALGFIKPHLPFVAPQRYWDLYDREQFSMPTNLHVPPGYPDYAANVTAWELKFYHDYEGTRPTEFSDELNHRLLHGYAACVSYVDACLGRVLDALQVAGLAENTIVVLWGDHGYRLGEHSSWTKHTNFETDVRVPLIVRVPRRGQGAVCESIVELVDLYPTLCDLASLPIPTHCQGQSFAGLFDDVNSMHRRSAYSSYPAQEGVSEKAASGMIEGPFKPATEMAMGHSIRFGDYRYTEWRPRPDQPATTAVLTDLATDPGEQTNVIQNPEHSVGLQEARKLLDQRIQSAVQVTSLPTQP